MCVGGHGHPREGGTTLRAASKVWEGKSKRVVALNDDDNCIVRPHNKYSVRANVI